MNSKSWIKIVVLVPVVGALVYFFSERVTAKAEPTASMSELYVNASKSELAEVDFDLTLELKPNGAISFEIRNMLRTRQRILIKGRKANAENFNINLITSATTKMGDLGDFSENVRSFGHKGGSTTSPSINMKVMSSRNKSDLTTHYSIIYQGQLSRNKVDLPRRERKILSECIHFLSKIALGELVLKSYRELNEEEKSFYTHR